jgi:hypothetical protein
MLRTRRRQVTNATSTDSSPRAQTSLLPRLFLELDADCYACLERFRTDIASLVILNRPSGLEEAATLL